MSRIYVVISQDSEKISIPTKISEFENDQGYISTELDPHLEDYVPILKHTLTIGENIFDGSEDITIPVYEGGYEQQ